MKNATLTVAAAIIVITTVCFAYNSSVLDNQARQDLDKVVMQLDSLADYTVHLGGHTDNTGTSERNVKLSEERALAVKNYLLSKNVNSAKITIDFHGEEEPLMPNTSAENMSLNRRVELTVTGQKITPAETATILPEEPKAEPTTPKADETLVAPVKSELKKPRTHRRLVWTGWKTGFHWSTSGR